MNYHKILALSAEASWTADEISQWAEFERALLLKNAIARLEGIVQELKRAQGPALDGHGRDHAPTLNLDRTETY